MPQLFIKTPLLYSIPLSNFADCNVYLKMEAMQPSGSFKDRGITNLCEFYKGQGVKGFVSSSGGNAGISVANAAKKLGLDAKIFVPKTALLISVQRMLSLGADVITVGDNWNQADQKARAEAQALDYAYIPPFDHPKIWEGYVSLIDELKESKLKPDAIVTSVGGGGLFSGIVKGLIKHNWLNTCMVTAETKGAATLATSFSEQKRIKLSEINTIASTLGAKQICQQAFDYFKTVKISPQVVSDKEAVEACLHFADDHRLLVEPACGAALSTLYHTKIATDDYENIVIIVCGGNGVSLSLFKEWQAKLGIRD